MKNPKKSGSANGDLRSRAEKRLKKRQPDPGASESDQDMKKLVHELQVHQVELEMQNDELQQARKRLEDSLAEYADLYDAAPIGYFSLDGSGKILQVNLAGARLLGSKRAHLIGEHFNAYVALKDRTVFNALLARLLSTNYAASCEIALDADELLYLCIEGTRAPEAGGNAEVRIVASDVSARVRAEQGLQSTLTELKRSNIELQRFATAACHDLHEPLRMVWAYLDLVKERYADCLDDDGREFVDFAREGAHRLQKMLDDLLDYSRATLAGPALCASDSSAALGTALSDLALLIRESGAQVTGPDLPMVRANTVLISRVFRNLITNSIRFCREKPPRIHVSARPKADQWVFAVEDNGIGMKEGDLDRIFGLFKRLHAHDEYPGTGVGLSLCKRIIERHGGSIWVESEEGKGSTFFFTLPATK